VLLDGRLRLRHHESMETTTTSRLDHDDRRSPVEWVLAGTEAAALIFLVLYATFAVAFVLAAL
jgi:hypothetical protein